MSKSKKYVIVRGRDSGLHVGTLATPESAIGSGRVKLLNSSRIWRWKGANTMSEVSLRGVDEEWSRISEQVPENYILDAIEVLPCTPEAAANLSRPRWGQG